MGQGQSEAAPLWEGLIATYMPPLASFASFSRFGMTIAYVSDNIVISKGQVADLLREGPPPGPAMVRQYEDSKE